MPDTKDPKPDPKAATKGAQKPAATPSTATVAGDGDAHGGDVDKGYADRPAGKGGSGR